MAVTELFVFGGPAPVPPECLGPSRALGVWQTAGDDEAVLELPPLRPRSGATHLLPSLSIATEHDHAFQFSMRTLRSGPWTVASPVGPWTSAPDRDTAAAVEERGISADIDVFRATAPVTELSMRVRLRARQRSAVLGAPSLLTVSLSSGLAGAQEASAADPASLALAVPALSQMEAPGALRARICSPTCVAMVLGYWDRAVDLVALAEEMHDARHDLYGVWPAAIRAAARHGVHGYLMRFPSWSAAEWCLRRGLPLIASIRYSAGELRGAAVASTPGHLIVLRGIDGPDVLVNDPAAPTAADVPRTYARADLTRVWLERTGVGYVLFPPAAAPPGEGQAVTAV